MFGVLGGTVVPPAMGLVVLPGTPSAPFVAAAPVPPSCSLLSFVFNGTVLPVTGSVNVVFFDVLLLMSRSAATVTAAWPGPSVRVTMSSIFFSSAAS